MLLLAGLISRAVAIEFRLMHASPGWIRFWNGAFSFGGIFSALLLGVAFGNIMRGLVIEANFVYHGGIIELFNPYAVLIGLVACTIFILHSAIYLRIKTEDEEPAERLRSIALNAYGVFLLLYGAAVIFTVQVSPFLFRKAGSLSFLCLALLLAVVLAAIPIYIRVHWKRAAFSASAATIALIITGTAYAAWPVLVPAPPGNRTLPDHIQRRSNSGDTPFHTDRRIGRLTDNDELYLRCLSDIQRTAHFILNANDIYPS